MSFPTRQQAEDYLAEANQLNPGPWISHSRNVALAARLLATHHPHLDPERAYVAGLLHDIGRRNGVGYLRHVLDGYQFLMEQGYPEAARYCLTHSYPVKDVSPYSSAWDGTTEGEGFVQDFLASIEYDDFDRLIQLCDGISLPEGFCLLEKRMVDVILRYGSESETPVRNIVRRWQGHFAVRQAIEEAIGTNIYTLLPGVVETTFGLKGEYL